MSFLLEMGATEGANGQNIHEHRYAIDPHGDGNTDISGAEDPHLHFVINGKVMPAGKDDHTHNNVSFPLENVPERF